MSLSRRFLIMLLACTKLAYAFKSTRHLFTSEHSTQQLKVVPEQLLDIIKQPIENYVNIWVPLMKDTAMPEFILRWGHGAAMSTVLASMGGVGTYLGTKSMLLLWGKQQRKNTPRSWQ